MHIPSTFLVFGGTGGTGRHFVSLALKEGHKVRVVVRDANRLESSSRNHSNITIHEGSITEEIKDLDDLVKGSDYVVAMLGNAAAQSKAKINLAFTKDQLVPAMRRQNVKRFLYQAGGLSKPYGSQLPMMFWILRYSMALYYAGQHADNDAVMEYLGTEATDIEWISHRAGIGGNGASKGKLQRSPTNWSVGTFGDVADYNYRVLTDLEAIHTCHTSYYA